MSNYTDASLIYYPSGYKAGKAYSLKPTNGSGDLDFTRASTATRVNSNGLIESVATGVPRIDYTSGCGKLLLEPQRTNLAFRSQELDVSPWTPIAASVTSNAAIAPDGTLTADKLIDTVTVTNHRVQQATSSAIGVNTFSVFAKKSELQYVALRIGSDIGYFNLNDGTFGALSVGITASTVYYGDGWYRCSITKTSASANESILINTADSIGNIFYGGTNGGFFLWGAQLEAGSYPTSYIPTLGTSVTRVADDARKNGISSLIGQTEGVIYFEFDYKKNQINTPLFQTSLGTTNAIYVLCLSDFKLRFIINLGGVSQVSITTATVPNLGINKLAIAYKANDAAFYLNGTQVGVDNSCSIPTVDSIYLTTANQNTQAFMTFTTRLSNTDLATLTTL